MITDAQIEQLRQDATQVRNWTLARYCRMALQGDMDARAIAEKVINHEPIGPDTYRVDTDTARLPELSAYLESHGMKYAIADDGTVFTLATPGQAAELAARGFTTVRT